MVVLLTLTCPKCETVRLKDGRDCMPCATKRMRRWALAHPDEYREKMRQGQQRHRDANPEKLKELNRRRHDAKLAHGRSAKGKATRVRNQHIRRARLVHAPAIEVVDREVLWNRDAGICGICGEAAEHANFHVDHKLALANGGSHTYANCQVSHPSCNVRKGAR